MTKNVTHLMGNVKIIFGILWVHTWYTSIRLKRKPNSKFVINFFENITITRLEKRFSLLQRQKHLSWGVLGETFLHSALSIYHQSYSIPFVLCLYNTYRIKSSTINCSFFLSLRKKMEILTYSGQSSLLVC